MAGELFTLAEAKSHLRVEHGREDADIASKLLAATEYVSRWVEVGILNESIVYDYYERIPVNPNYIDLPDRVAESIAGITGTYWLPDQDISQDPEGLLEINRTLNTRDGRLRIYADWDTVDKHDTLPLRFEYESGIAPDKIPTAWKEAGKLVLSSLYDGRTDVESGAHFRAAKSLLDPWLKFV